jgi:hypothetical protein
MLRTKCPHFADLPRAPSAWSGPALIHMGARPRPSAAAPPAAAPPPRRLPPRPSAAAAVRRKSHVGRAIGGRHWCPLPEVRLADV